MKVPGSAAPIALPSELLAKLLITEWEGLLAEVPDKPSILVSRWIISHT